MAEKRKNKTALEVPRVRKDTLPPSELHQNLPPPPQDHPPGLHLPPPPKRHHRQKTPPGSHRDLSQPGFDRPKPPKRSTGGKRSRKKRSRKKPVEIMRILETPD
eukprot:93862_1